MKENVSSLLSLTLHPLYGQPVNTGNITIVPSMFRIITYSSSTATVFDHATSTSPSWFQQQ